MVEEPKGDRLWLALCTATGVVVDVTLNKYSSQLPGIWVLCLWAIPMVLFAVWVWCVEKTHGWVKKRFVEHPVSYIVMFLIFLPFAWQASATMFAKLQQHFNQSPPTISQASKVDKSPPQSTEDGRPKKLPAMRDGKNPKPANTQPTTHTSLPVKTQPHEEVKCDNNSGNCADVNNGQQIVNQYS